MKDKDYWAKRFKAIEERAYEEAQKCIKESAKLLDEAIVQIDKDITYWLKRFAVNNEMTLAEAKKAISNKELEELGWDVEEYVKKGSTNAEKWEKELENASANYHITRLEAIKTQIESIYDKAFEGVIESMNEHLSNVYKDVYYRTAYEVQKGMGIGYSFAKVNENKLKMILESPWAVDGSDFSERVWGSYRTKLTNTLQQTLVDWCVRGSDIESLSREMSRKSGIAKSACSTLIRTETAQICTRAEMDSYEELGAEQYRVLETLDGKTCERCGDMDGKLFDREDCEVGVTAPPFHPNCRGTTVPEVDDELLKQGRKRAARDKDGNTVYVDDMTYKEWKEKFVEEGGRLKEDRIKSYMAYESTVDWGNTEPKEHTKEEKHDIINYAEEKNVNIYNISAFDGDADILKEQIDVLSDTLKEYNIGNKVTITFSNKMDDEDFAQTNNFTIMFNTKTLRGRNITNKILNNDDHLSSTDIKGIVIHEVGHLISKKYGEKGLEIAKKAYYNIYKEEIDYGNLLDFLKEYVSGYSAVFAEQKQGRPFKSKYCKEVLPEILAKNKTNPNEFTRECIRLLKEMIL